MLGQKANALVDENFQVLESHSAAAGLDFSGTGPEISYLHSIGRLKFAPPVTDKSPAETEVATKDPARAVNPSFFNLFILILLVVIIINYKLGFFSKIYQIYGYKFD